jgi:hypothetical protein
MLHIDAEREEDGECSRENPFTVSSHRNAKVFSLSIGRTRAIHRVCIFQLQLARDSTESKVKLIYLKVDE